MKKIFKRIALCSVLGVSVQFAQAQVKIGDNPTAINKAAILELESSTKGLLFPRVNLTNTTTWSLATGSTPSAGMVVYNTKTLAGGFTGTTAYPAIQPDGTGLYYWDGAGWVSVKGNAGNSMLSGNGAPSNGTGKDGDFYFDPATGIIYGPKAGGVWPAGVNLKGTDGKTVLNGIGNPTASVGKDGDFYIDPSTAVIYGPKANGVWPAGVSMVGPAGATGVDGRSLLNGTGAPTAATGKTGDFYIDIATNTIYGPKSGGVWPAGISLKGADGKSILNGTGAPSAATGKDGDFYIDPTTNMIYGPKAGGAWPAGSSLKGATGATGADGKSAFEIWQSLPGNAGKTLTDYLAAITGPAGADGKSVLSGTGAPGNGTGKDGDFYFDPSTGTIYGPKAGGVWPAGVSLKGATGADGKTILSGIGDPTNAMGKDGDFYIDPSVPFFFGPKANGVWPDPISLVGPTGAAGVDGKSLLSGTGLPTSATGKTGDFYIDVLTNTIYGPKGNGVWPPGVSLKGADGKTVLNGTGAPTAAVGKDGDFYIDPTTNMIYGPKAGGAWPAGVSLVGATGATGADGKSAFEIWQSLPGNAGKTTTDYLAAITGPAGADGKTVLNGTGAPTAATGKDGDFYIDPTTGTLYGPKAGGAWPAGVSLKGATGANGADGKSAFEVWQSLPGNAGKTLTDYLAAITGPAGADGKSVLSGTGAPANGTGKDGDFYIDPTTGTLYGPKANGVWPPGVSLKGVDGKTVLNGTGAPTAAVGKDGDFYIDPTTNMIYGPKAGGAWPAGVSLVGATGATGADGKSAFEVWQSLPGNAGKTTTDYLAAITGPAGADGKTVLNGTGSPTAATGKDGDFYIDPTTGTLYGPKVGGAWPAGVSLKGATGANGADGKSAFEVWQSLPGNAGKTLTDYLAAITGPAGADGKSVLSGTGAPGNGTGKDGDFYIDPTTGTLYGPKAGGAWPAGVSLQGADGKTVLNGTGAPANGTGKDGDFYIDPTTNTIYGPKAGGAWPAGVSLKGATGANGADGKSAFEVWQSLPGNAGKTTTDYLAAITGPAGADGKTVLNGTGAPTAATGKDGDFYIDPTTGTLYGPKAGGAWPAGVSLKGATGANGADGKSAFEVWQSLPGNAGKTTTDYLAAITGPAGADGKTVLNGTGAPTAATGKDGDFYIDPTTNTIYGPKAGGAWPAGVSLKGANGQGGVTQQGTDIEITGAGTVANPYVVNSALTFKNGLEKQLGTSDIELGGALTRATTITTDATKTLALQGLQAGAASDKIVVADVNGILKLVNPSSSDLRVVGTGNHITQDAGVGSNGTSVGTGANNIGIGFSTLAANTSGYDNVAVGALALTANTTGNSNTALGGFTLARNTDGQSNTAVGYGSLSNNTSGLGNTALGYGALKKINTGNFNLGLGPNTLEETTTGEENIGIGHYGAYNITTGSHNLAIGYETPLVDPTASYQMNIKNSIFGKGMNGTLAAPKGLIGINVSSPTNTLHVRASADPLRLEGLQVGSAGDNFVVADANGVLKTISSSSLVSDLRFVGTSNHITQDAGIGNNGTSAGTGGYNIGLGEATLSSNTTGNYNIAMGLSALSNNTQGWANVALGAQSGESITTGSDNIFIGAAAGLGVDVGSKNIAIGSGAQVVNPSGSYQMSIGNTIFGLGMNGTLGTPAGSIGINTYAPTNTLHVYATADPLRLEGLQAGSTSDNIVVADGTGVLKTISSSSLVSDLRMVGTSNHITQDAGVGGNGTSVGTGRWNIAIGKNTLKSNTNGTGNVAIGHEAMLNNTGGGSNVAMGYFALSNNVGGASNTAIGESALLSNTGDSNTAVGQGAAIANTYGYYNVALGVAALASNTTGIQNTALGVSALVNSNGNDNIALGYNSGFNITTGSNNLILGNDVQAPSATADNQMNIKNTLFGTGMNGTLAAPAGSIGINTSAPTHTLHVKATADPLRLEGLQAGSASDNIVVADGTGVLKTVAASSIGANNWSLLGNAGTNPTNNFLGTTDAQALTFRTDNAARMVIDATGNVGIGTAIVPSKLNVLNTVPTGQPVPDAIAVFTSQTNTSGTTRESNAEIRVIGNDGATPRAVTLGIGKINTYGDPDVGYLTLGPSGALMMNGSGMLKVSTANPTTSKGVSSDGVEFYNNKTVNANAYSFDSDVPTLNGTLMRIKTSATAGTGNLLAVEGGQAGAITVIDKNGQLGLGTAAPNAKLEITSATAGTSGLRFTNLTNAVTTATGSAAALGVNANGDVVVMNTASSTAAKNIINMPSVAINVSTAGTFTLDLYNEYKTQYNTPMAASTGAPAAIPTLAAATDFYYYITYFDNTIFTSVSVNASGVLTYTVTGASATTATFMNIVLVPKN